MKKLLILFIVFTASLGGLYSQTKTIKGRVIAEGFETLPMVSITLNDKDEVGKTDLDGFFQIDIPASEKEILFDFVGMESVIINLKENCGNVEVVMMPLYSYDFVSPKQVERKRKKRYNKIAKVHKQAFEKGLFETDCPCYKREFESHYPPGDRAGNSLRPLGTRTDRTGISIWRGQGE